MMISTKKLTPSKHTLLLLIFTLLLILLVPRLLPLLQHPHLHSHTATKGQGPRTKDRPHLPSHKENKDNGSGEWLREQERRRTRIAKFCANKVMQQNFDRLHFHFNKEHNLLFCFQPKVRLFNLMWNKFVAGWIYHLVESFHQPGKKRCTRETSDLGKIWKSEVSCPHRSRPGLPCKGLHLNIYGEAFFLGLFDPCLLGEASVWTTCVCLSKQGWEFKK